DGAASWTAVNTGLPALSFDTFLSALAIDPRTPSTLYALGTLHATSGVLFKSTDSGANWTATISTGLRPGGLPLAINPVTPSTLYAGTFGEGVLKTTDGGMSWTAVNTGPTTDFLALAINPVTPSTLYAGTFGEGVLKTTDGGGSWTVVN